jgi:hypothetical protein
MDTIITQSIAQNIETKQTIGDIKDFRTPSISLMYKKNTATMGS